MINEIDESLIGRPDYLLIEKLMKGIADEKEQAAWVLLFDTYNKETNSKLQMKCRICYMKIYLWYKTKLRLVKES